MQDLVDRAVTFATLDRTVDAVRAALILVITIFLTRIGSRAVRRIMERRGDAQQTMLAGRLVTWLLLALGVSAAFEELGFKLHVLLGAAGVLSIAVGFAAQTTLSNLISGFFLFGERPFSVGDVIEVEGVTGEVLGIELLATSLRTADHRFVRIPNEILLKSRLTNASRYLRRRLEIVVPVANDEDYEKVKAAVEAAVAATPLCLPEPAPSVFIGAFGETSIQVTVWVWAEKQDLHAVRVALSDGIHGALGQAKRTVLGR